MRYLSTIHAAPTVSGFRIVVTPLDDADNEQERLGNAVRNMDDLRAALVFGYSNGTLTRRWLWAMGDTVSEWLYQQHGFDAVEGVVLEMAEAMTP